MEREVLFPPGVEPGECWLGDLITQESYMRMPDTRGLRIGPHSGGYQHPHGSPLHYLFVRIDEWRKRCQELKA